MKLRAVRGVTAAAAALCAMLFVTGCTDSVAGRAVSIYDDPFQVAGLPTTDGPNGPRPGVPDSSLRAANGNNGDMDTLALNAVEDIQTYWNERFTQEFDSDFSPVTHMVSWNAKASRSESPNFCGESTYDMVNAAYCGRDNSIGWDRSLLLPAMTQTFGPMAVVTVLAHEYGHAIQSMARTVAPEAPVIVKEQQADCFAGSFVRHVAEGGSKHFTLNTSAGLNSVLAATVAIRDSDPDDPESVHGSAFERVTAVQIGFTDGPRGCTGIDMDEIEQRRGDLPQSFESDSGHGEYPVTEDTLVELEKALGTILPVATEPVYRYDSAEIDCTDGSSTAPVSYCPADNTIATDVVGLSDRGTSETESDEPLPVKVTGDYNGYVVFIARYALAVQHDKGQDLTGAKAGLRSACLSGVATGKLAEPGRGPTNGDIVLSAGDLDEAVSGLLTDGLAASDIRGETVPSGFARVDAFRAGVLTGESACMSRYS